MGWGPSAIQTFLSIPLGKTNFPLGKKKHSLGKTKNFSNVFYLHCALGIKTFSESWKIISNNISAKIDYGETITFLAVESTSNSINICVGGN